MNKNNSEKEEEEEPEGVFRTLHHLEIITGLDLNGDGKTQV
jgi:hypothetical protein